MSFKENDLTLKNKTIIATNKYCKVTRSYDSLGYLTEIKTIKRGLIKYHNTLGGSSNEKTILIYSNDYKNIRVECYRSHWNRFPLKTKKQINEYTFDDSQNLLSTKSFDCYLNSWFMKRNYYYN